MRLRTKEFFDEIQFLWNSDRYKYTNKLNKKDNTLERCAVSRWSGLHGKHTHFSVCVVLISSLLKFSVRYETFVRFDSTISINRLKVSFSLSESNRNCNNGVVGTLVCSSIKIIEHWQQISKYWMMTFFVDWLKKMISWLFGFLFFCFVDDFSEKRIDKTIYIVTEQHVKPTTKKFSFNNKRTWAQHKYHFLHFHKFSDSALWYFVGLRDKLSSIFGKTEKQIEIFPQIYCHFWIRWWFIDGHRPMIGQNDAISVNNSSYVQVCQLSPNF